MVVGKTAAGHLYSRLIPLVLLLVDGMHSFVLVVEIFCFPPFFSLVAFLNYRFNF